MKTLFISYSWSDGSGYADELERELSDYFEVKRDKSQLNANDDITQFMGGSQIYENMSVRQDIDMFI